MEILLKGKNISKDYKMGEVTVHALKNANFEIYDGEFIVVLGPSGSGKSTLLNIIGGMDKPTSGELFYENMPLHNADERSLTQYRRDAVGFVFQFYNLIPNLNVEENILLPVLLDGKRLKSYRDKLDEILETVGLAGHRRHTPRELSGGQQQRVAIARALINDPDLILADEPIGNLDSKTGMEVMALLQRINLEKGKTIVQVTHSREAASYGQRIINVRDGKVWE